MQPSKSSEPKNAPHQTLRVCLRHYTLPNFNPPTTILATTNNVAPASMTTPQKTCSRVYEPVKTSGTRAPPIGVPVRAAKEIIEKQVPLRTPTSRRSEIWAMRAGARETKAPEPKPYRALKMMAGALLREGIQRARTRMAER